MFKRYCTVVLLTFICGLVTAKGAPFLDTPPSPDNNSSCGGNCQAICVNGCDSNTSYSWQQATCVNNSLSDAAGTYCNDGYVCGSGACGRASERACNTAGTGCSSCAAGYMYDATKAYCVVASANPGNHPTWMHDNAASLNSRSLNSITIPGSHDSGTYTMTGFAQAETKNILQQLQGGIRMFDLRPSTLFYNIVIHHGIDFTGPKLQDILNDVKTFVSTSPGEVVLLHFSSFAGEGTVANSSFTTANYQALSTMIQSTLGPYLINHSVLTPNSLFANFTSTAHGSVVVIWDEGGASGIKSYWSGGSYVGSYGDTIDQAEMRTRLIAIIQSNSIGMQAGLSGQPGKIGELYIQATPSPDNPQGPAYAKSWFPLWLAEDTNPVTLRWLAQDKALQAYNWNVITTDSFENSCLVPFAIWANNGGISHGQSTTTIPGCYNWPTSNQTAWDAKAWPY